MKVQRVRYRGWPEAYRCSLNALELIEVTSMGSRIPPSEWRTIDPHRPLDEGDRKPAGASA